jgi:hypothetical protein
VTHHCTGRSIFVRIDYRIDSFAAAASSEGAEQWEDTIGHLNKARPASTLAN